MSLIPSIGLDTEVTVTDAAGHSETLQLHMSDHNLDAFEPGGAELLIFESAGHVVGARKGGRVFPTMTVSAMSAAGLSDFEMLIFGLTSGFVSTGVAIGDAVMTSTTIQFSYGAESRGYTFAHCTWKKSKKAGDPWTASYTMTCHGVCQGRDDSGTLQTIVAAL